MPLEDERHFCARRDYRMHRINWIDWAKALAVTTVVFCHLPQSQEWFYYRYLQACIITVFFFISGYLKKDRGYDKENWRYYWHGLLTPYIIYNVVVYPYWLVKYYMLHGDLPDFFSAIRPLLGALLFEHENSFCEPLNGPLWYLPAILIMHITIDLCRKTRHLHIIMFTFCIISFFLYAGNKYYAFLPNLTPMGIFRRLPYYYIGYVMGQHHVFGQIRPKWDLLCCVTCFAISLLFFEWHLHEERLFVHVATFYPVNLGFLFGVLYGCKVLDSIKSTAIIYISIGSLVIISLHTILIGIINYAIEHYINPGTPICYHWYEGLPIALIIIAILFPIILLGKKYAPILIGK